MKKVFCTILTALLLSNFAIAQRELYVYTHTKKVDENRYEGIKGNPFLFKDWMKASMKGNQDTVYSDLQMNYNGYEESFELLIKERFNSLDERHYSQVTIEHPDGDIYFEKNLHPKLPDKFFRLIYKGDNITCFSEFAVSISENTVQDVGRTVKFKKFKADPVHFFIINGNLNFLRLNKKNITLLLTEKKAVNAFIKKNKLKVTSDRDLKALLDYYDKSFL